MEISTRFVFFFFFNFFNNFLDLFFAYKDIKACVDLAWLASVSFLLGFTTTESA